MKRFRRPRKCLPRPRLWLLAAALVTLTLLLAVPPTLHAQDDLVTDHDYTFGQTAELTLQVRNLDATEATLFLRVNDESVVYSVSIDAGRAQYQRDLREQPFPPFAKIDYWWGIEDKQGQSYTTPKVTFAYNDNRFDWQTLTEDTVTVKWVAGEPALMSNALDIAQASLDDIQHALQAPRPEAITLYIYPSLPDLQSALRLAGRDWVGGQAYPDLDVALLTFPPTPEAVLKMKRDIPHELTHQLTYDLVGPQGYEDQPAWLLEGLASYFERSPDPAYVLALDQASQSGQLIPLKDLCTPFTGDRDDALLAYAQSQSMLKYLVRTQGWSQVRALLNRYADGLDCNAGVEQALGQSLDALDREWRVWLETNQRSGDAAPQTAWITATILIRDLAPWLLLLAITTLPGAIFLIGARVR